jgi:hypothetical protein
MAVARPPSIHVSAGQRDVGPDPQRRPADTHGHPILDTGRSPPSRAEPTSLELRRCWWCQRWSVAGATSMPIRRRTGSSRPRAAIRARSAQVMCGRGVCHRSTASWWRRTRISISLAVSQWFRSTIQLKSLQISPTSIKINNSDALAQPVAARLRQPLVRGAIAPVRGATAHGTRSLGR